MDPLTFVELATGRLAWADARAGGRISASGIRADLSELLPLPPYADAPDEDVADA